jgi:hypothetical protein
MKRTVIRFALLCLAAGAWIPAGAQTTITATDVTTQLAVGHQLITHTDTLATTANIGAPGSNTWNFSGLASHVVSTLTSVAPASTPFAGSFTGETHAFSSLQTLQGISGTVYEYLTLGTNLTDLGNMGQAATPFGTATLTTVNTPAQLVYALPMTLNSTWTANFTSILVVTISGIPFFTDTSVYHSTFLVDAFGSLTVPGGGPYPALRIKKVDSVTVKSVSYQILAANGASVTIKCADPNATSGTIVLGGYATWSGPISTGVEDKPGIPSAFALNQNYPNPFNPSTNISYELSSASHVRIAVSDLLGREVAVLVDAERPAGSYNVAWEARGVSSGVYFCTMQAGSFRTTRTMLLMK